MIDCKDYCKAIPHHSGILLYIPKSVLEMANIDFKKKLLVKRYATKSKNNKQKKSIGNKQIILRFKEVNNE